MNDDPLSRIRVVLVRTSLARNIGSAARAMKAMGVTQLVLVNPKSFPDAEADALASGADDLLRGAHVVGSLAEGIADCVAAYALSARAREWGPTESFVREAAAKGVARTAQGEVASFSATGERLSNEGCWPPGTCIIPANPAFSSGTAAVQIVAYELRMAPPARRPPGLPPATMADLEGLYAA
jgi:TrmH family RNA methyltransferase